MQITQRKLNTLWKTNWAHTLLMGSGNGQAGPNPSQDNQLPLGLYWVANSGLPLGLQKWLRQTLEEMLTFTDHVT